MQPKELPVNPGFSFDPNNLFECISGQHWKAFQTNTSADPPLLRVAAVSASRARWMQVGFRDQKAVKKVVALKTNEIVNRLNRTKREESPDLAARREAYDAEVSARCCESS